MTLREILAIVLGLIGIVAITALVVWYLVREDYDDYDDDDDYDNDDDYDDDDEYPEVSGGGVPYPVVVHSPDYSTGDISYTDMMLRLARPLLYSDDWYDITRRDFSRWAVTQYQVINTFREDAA